jgi:hypothetical protein
MDRQTWTPLARVFEHFNPVPVPTAVRDAFSLLNCEMVGRINVGCTRGYVDLKVPKTIFHTMRDMLNQFPGDYEWSFVFVSDHKTMCFEYRVLPGTESAGMAAICGVAYARKLLAEEGEQAMRKMLACRKRYNDEPTVMEMKRARGGDETGGCACCGSPLSGPV